MNLRKQRKRQQRKVGREEEGKRWVGEGGKATLVGAPDADTLLEAIEELQKRTAGAATFLGKVKAHRGEPANEEADIQADKAILGKDFPTEMARQDKSSSFHMVRASPERRYGELRRSKVDLEQLGAEGD